MVMCKCRQVGIDSDHFIFHAERTNFLGPLLGRTPRGRTGEFGTARVSFHQARGSAGLQIYFDCLDMCHDTPCSPLRRVPEVLNSVFAWFQSLPQWVVPDAARSWILGRMDLVLFVRQATRPQSMDLERVEVVCRVQSSSPPWLWATRGDRAGGQ